MNIKIKIKNIGNLMANADIELETSEYGMIIIKDFAIWKSSYKHPRLGDYVSIKPPALKRGNIYAAKVHFLDEEMWMAVEEEIYHAYRAKESVERKKRSISK